MNTNPLRRRTPTWATRSVILLALVLSGGWNLLFAGLSGAQGEAPGLSQGIIDEGLEAPAALAAKTPASAAVPQGIQQASAVRVYLPMVVGRPQYTAQFATEVDQSLNPVAPSISFARGVTQIYAVLALNGVAGQPWRTEWYRNNLRIPGLVASGTIPAGQQEARLVRRMSYANNGALPLGTYKIVLSINDRRAFEAEFQVVP